MLGCATPNWLIRFPIICSTPSIDEEAIFLKNASTSASVEFKPNSSVSLVFNKRTTFIPLFIFALSLMNVEIKSPPTVAYLFTALSKGRLNFKSRGLRA